MDLGWIHLVQLHKFAVHRIVAWEVYFNALEKWRENYMDERRENYVDEPVAR
jgi:hypothetical protein